ncbi:MAG: LPS export ABC transporter periplasmic protein LptC [Deltaproteobacteria bacterium]|nr:LPS export ABC transporter periplasmic protein LptC [Deltaproteobacteria bacterium]
MKKNIKTLLTILLIAFVFAISISLFLNYRLQKGVKDISPQTPSNADVVISKIHYIEDKDGKKEWELEADSAQYFQGGDVTELEDVKITFYSKDGKIYEAKGKRGKLMNETKDVELTGDVVVTSNNGYKLTTTSLNYTSSKRQITTKERVFLTGSKIYAEGNGLLLDMNKETVSILKNVRTVIKHAKT